jgi:hypothetical protein
MSSSLTGAHRRHRTLRHHPFRHRPHMTTVPAGASTGMVTVTTGGGTAVSPNPFTVS